MPAPAIMPVLMRVLAGCVAGLAAGAWAGFALKSTTGGGRVDAVDAGAAGAGAATGAAGAVACVATWLVVTCVVVRTGAGAGFAVAWTVCLTVFVLAVVVDGAVVEVVSGAGLVSVVDGAVASGVGAGAGVGVGVAAGAVGSVVTGWACCATSGVDESARAAAIAGRALACAYLFAFLIMGENRHL